MKTRAKRCTAHGKLVDGKNPNVPTEKKLPDGQHADHYVLCPEDRAKGYVEPIRYGYKHLKCGCITTMGASIAQTYAAQPEYYGSTFCCHCRGYFPVGENGEFVWDKTDGQKVGTRRTQPEPHP